MLEELGERPVEADPLPDRLHLGPVSGDLSKPDLVHLVRRQRQGRVLLDQGSVERVAAAHVDEAAAFPGMRKIFVAQEVAKAPIGGIDVVDDRRLVRLAKPLAFGFRNRLREILNRAEERRFLRRRGELGVELADHVADRQLALDHARSEAFTEAEDRPVDSTDEVAVPLEIILIILDVSERRRVPARGEDRIEGVEAGEVVDRPDRGERQHLGGEIGEVFLALIFEDVIGDPVGLVEGRPVDRRERCQIGLSRRPLAGKIFVGEEVAEAVRIAVIAAEHAGEGVAAQIGLVARPEQSVELLARRRRHRRRCRRFGRRLGGGGRGPDGGDERSGSEQGDISGHDGNPPFWFRRAGWRSSRRSSARAPSSAEPRSSVPGRESREGRSDRQAPAWRGREARGS